MRAMADGLEPVISRPSKKIWPRVGVRKCVSRLKQVVLPAPLGPMRAWMLPRCTLSATSFTATKPLNSFVSPRVSKIASSANPLPLCCGAQCYNASMLWGLPLLEECVHSLPALVVGEARRNSAGGSLIGLGGAELHLLVERA